MKIRYRYGFSERTLRFGCFRAGRKSCNPVLNSGIPKPRPRKRVPRGLWLLRGMLLPMLAVLLLSCSAPTGEARSPEELVMEMCETQKELPDGQLYTSSAKKGEDGYIGEALLIAFFGGGDSVPWQVEGAEQYAMYLGFRAPAAFAVFRCTTQQDANMLAELCLKRVSVLGGYWSALGWTPDALSGVTVHGHDVHLRFFCEKPGQDEGM